MNRNFLYNCESVCLRIEAVQAERIEGRIASAASLTVGIGGLAGHAAVGDQLMLQARGGGAVPAEIVGIRDGMAQALAFAPLDGVGAGSTAIMPLAPMPATLAVCDGWIGRVVDPFGRALDGRGDMPQGNLPRQVRAPPPPASARARLGPRIALGVRALDLFATCRQGQRLGLFAGPGIGKSTLLGMLARHVACDVAVVGLIGERGREVREFLEDDLGVAGMARAVTIVATSDASPLLRREAALTAMTVAEHFRDRGHNVLLLLDSLTRYCLALREIGLAAGEPPATRGFPPSVFADLPRLLERAGPGREGEGQITALFTVLMEGDDPTEPVADAVRGFLDGHVVLDRAIAERGRYPAIDVLRSLSRCAAGCIGADEAALIRRARGILALAAEMADLVRLGAYRRGADPAADEALLRAPRIEAVLSQQRDAVAGVAESFAALRDALEKD